MTDQLVLQFSTAAPDWRTFIPGFARRPKAMCLVGDKNWGSSLIRRSCHSPFSHVDMVMPDGSLVGASNSPNAPVIEGNPGGVARRPPDYQHFRYRRRMILETDRAEDIRRIWCSQIGKDFDNSALKDFISDRFPGYRDWRLDDHWFCAEGILWSLETGGLWAPVPLIWPKNRSSPTDILILLLMDRRWINRDIFWDPVPGLPLGPGER